MGDPKAVEGSHTIMQIKNLVNHFTPFIKAVRTFGTSGGLQSLSVDNKITIHSIFLSISGGSEV